VRRRSISRMAAPGNAIDEALYKALSGVEDPEIHRPITELGMVSSATVTADGTAEISILLTVAGCPLRERLRADITAAARTVDGVSDVRIQFGAMSQEQRQDLQRRLRGPAAAGPEPEIPFAKPESTTRVFAIASGKGGVGKSSITVNLAAALAAEGLSVGVVDADIYGHSVPRMLGVEAPPTKVEQMIMPPQANGVQVISIGMFTQGNSPVVWRGPMLHRILQQFLADVYWGDLDILLLDLPPGTGDIAISLAQLLPNAQIVVVTTPQEAAAEVAERAGAITLQTHQPIAGVIENMSWLELPTGERMEIFGSGGGRTVADSLSEMTGSPVPLLGQIPMEPRLRECGDDGQPLVLAAPDCAAAMALRAVAQQLGQQPNSLAGKQLGLAPS
jgi:ATP-binding protein involved in chromosome partitioning